MILQDQDRTFVVYEKITYLMLIPEDSSNNAFLAGKDVLLAGKFERSDHENAFFYHYDTLPLIGQAEYWNTRLDGDNLFVFGRISGSGNLVLKSKTILDAPSDGSLIERRLKSLEAKDYPGRMQVAIWAHAQAETQGNREFWLQASDTISTAVVKDALATLDKNHDAALLRQAFDWSLTFIDDKKIAADIASLAWIGDAGDVAEYTAKAMRKLDYTVYNGRWLPHVVAVQTEFNQRFDAIKWKDADGYYKLGRWVESQSDVLPNSRELEHRCYQAGFRADEKHNGIRHKLGMPRAAGASSVEIGTAERYQNTATGISVAAPEGWASSNPIEGGDVTWVDPSSETAYISVRILPKADQQGSFDEIFGNRRNALQAKSGFTMIDEVAVPFAAGQGRRIHYSTVEGRFIRLAEMTILMQAPVAIIIHASYADTEAASVQKAVDAVCASVVPPPAP
jgi:hypothetical protein